MKKIFDVGLIKQGPPSAHPGDFFASRQEPRLNLEFANPPHEILGNISTELSSNASGKSFGYSIRPQSGEGDNDSASAALTTLQEVSTRLAEATFGPPDRAPVTSAGGVPIATDALNAVIEKLADAPFRPVDHAHAGDDGAASDAPFGPPVQAQARDDGVTPDVPDSSPDHAATDSGSGEAKATAALQSVIDKIPDGPSGPPDYSRDQSVAGMAAAREALQSAIDRMANDLNGPPDHAGENPGAAVAESHRAEGGRPGDLLAAANGNAAAEDRARIENNVAQLVSAIAQFAPPAVGEAGLFNENNAAPEPVLAGVIEI